MANLWGYWVGNKEWPDDWKVGNSPAYFTLG